MPRLLPYVPLRVAIALLGLLPFFLSVPVDATNGCPSSETLQGAWAAQDGAVQLLFEPHRVVLLENEILRAATIQRRDSCNFIVRDGGVLATWVIKSQEGALVLNRGAASTTLRRLPQAPAALDISPLPLPTSATVSPETAASIARELADRSARDQEALRSETLKRSEVLEDNIRYLRTIVSRYGWIDIPRFGKAGAAAAILIAKHSSDLRLLQNALPVAERDARENGGGKELVAILVDEVLIATGHKQKYGTQLTEDEQGAPFVIPVEDVAAVDAHRRVLGIEPWSEYLKKASRALYDGKPIRIPGPEE